MDMKKVAMKVLLSAVKKVAVLVALTAVTTVYAMADSKVATRVC